MVAVNTAKLKLVALTVLAVICLAVVVLFLIPDSPAQKYLFDFMKWIGVSFFTFTWQYFPLFLSYYMSVPAYIFSFLCMSPHYILMLAFFSTPAHTFLSHTIFYVHTCDSFLSLDLPSSLSIIL
jgi:hypothetical protein